MWDRSRWGIEPVSPLPPHPHRRRHTPTAPPWAARGLSLCLAAVRPQAVGHSPWTALLSVWGRRDESELRFGVAPRSRRSAMKVVWDKPEIRIREGRLLEGATSVSQDDGGLGLSVRIPFRTHWIYELAEGEPTPLKCCLFLLESRGEDVFIFSFYLTSLIAQLVKNLPAKQETRVGSLGRGDRLEKGKPTHSSILGLTLWFSW